MLCSEAMLRAKQPRSASQCVPMKRAYFMYACVYVYACASMRDQLSMHATAFARTPVRILCMITCTQARMTHHFALALEGASRHDKAQDGADVHLCGKQEGEA